MLADLRVDWMFDNIRDCKKLLERISSIETGIFIILLVILCWMVFWKGVDIIFGRKKQ